MAKTDKNTVKTQASKTRKSKADLIEVTEVDQKAPTEETSLKGQAPKPSTEVAPIVSAEDRQMLRRIGAKMLANAQVDGSVSISCRDSKVTDLALKHGSRGLVDEFAPADAVESTLAPVIVGIRNAVMTGLHLATKGSSERRDVELNIALKGAGVLAQLLEAFDAHRGHGSRRVTVGNVNVESGAQAIVGNVETTPRQEPRTEAPTVEPIKRRKPRAA
jgi:hypothetical protein